MNENNYSTLICKECNMEKDVNEFPIDKRSKTGHRNICKDCYNKIYKNRNKKNISDPVKIIKKYLETNYPSIYKTLLIQSIAEETDFIEVLINSINLKQEYIMIVKQFENRNQK